MSSPNLQKLRGALPFLIAIAVLALIVIATRLSVMVGYDGIEFNPLTGEISEIDPQGPAAGVFQAGDQLVSVDQTPIVDIPPMLAEHRAGDTLQFLVERDGASIESAITLAEKPPRIIVQYLVTPLAALSFWAIGVVVRAFGRDSIQTRLFFAFTLITSATLTAGTISSEGPDWASTLFNVLVWFAGPVAVNLHLHFPEPTGERRLRWLSLALYAIAGLGSLPFLVLGSAGVRASRIGSMAFSASRLLLSVNLLLVVLLLGNAYRSASSVNVRQRVRLVVLGGGLGLLLVIVLSILPGTLLGEPLVPYDYAFAFLIAIPASYGYAIVRHRLIGYEKFLSRGAAYALVFVLLAAGYLALTSLLDALLPVDLLGMPLFNMTLILLLTGTAALAYQRIQALVDFAFYGGWYDFPSALEHITSNLETLRDSQTLSDTLAERLESTLRLQAACVFVAVSDGSLRLGSSNGHQPAGLGTDGNSPQIASEDASPRLRTPISLPAEGALVSALSDERTPRRAGEVSNSLSQVPLTKQERAVLHDLEDYLLVPIPGGAGLHGLLALGPRKGGEEFSAEDLAILIQVARHAGAAIETVRLASEVKRKAEEVRQLNKRLMQAREQERKAFSRRLHDEAIQALIGMNYRLGSAKPEDLRDELRQIVERLRGMIRELRPHALDTFGLATAVRTEIRERSARANSDLRIDLMLTGDSEMALPDDASTCVYRVIQETLNNVERHAEAHQVQVQLILEPEAIQVIVQDDGRGFEVPKPLGALVEADHFGLVGLRERVQLLNGTLEIHSIPGKGTTVQVAIPLLRPAGRTEA